MGDRIAAIVLLMVVTTGVLADHHGRGHEPTSGFPGIYDGGRLRLTFTGDGYLIVVVKSSNVAASVQTYAIAEDVLTVRDVSPAVFFKDAMRDCTLTSDGHYRMVRQESGYQLELIEDPCAARAGLLTSVALSDYVRPEPDSSP
jgi:hypothetical protein